VKKTLFAIAAGLLLALPTSCMHPGHHAGPGGQGCPKHRGCDCTCRQQPDCPKADCPSTPDCPKHQAPAAPAK
jgi:hypothetical protein